MLRTIVVAIGVSIMVVGGVLPANADDDDKGAKKQHQAILNAVKSDTDSDTAAHAAQSADHAALSHKVDEVRTAIGNISTGGSAGGDHSGLPPTWDKVLSADNPADPCNSSRFKCVMPTGTNLNFEAVRDKRARLGEVAADLLSPVGGSYPFPVCGPNDRGPQRLAAPFLCRAGKPSRSVRTY